jgi:serine phosphatase RsbU (regulator of sigma subunit)
MDGHRRGGQPTPPPTAGDAPPARRRLSITNRLRLSFLISSTLPLLLVGGLLIAVLFRVQQRNAFASQQAVADQIAGNIATFLYDLEQQLLRAARELRPESDVTLLRAQSQRLVNSSPDLRALTVVDAEGTVLASVTNDLLTAQGTPPAPLEDALLRGATSIGQGGRTAIKSGADGQPMFQVALPIRDPETFRIVGALATEVSAARVRQILRLGVQGQQKTVYLIDAQRQVQLSDAVPGWRQPVDLSTLFAEGQTVAEYPGGDGEQVVGARAPVARVSSATWWVIVEQASSEFFTEVYRSLLLLAALVALMTVMGLTWALFQSRRLVLPIRALTEGARELASGRLDHRIEVEPGDELGQLATTFNDMAERLQGSLHEIERQNERLRHGLVLARDIQQGLLPAVPPWRAEMLSVYGRSMPASEVGGDFYTYLALPDGRAAVAIGDISGKGVAAALLMALTSSMLESQAHDLDHPAEMLRTLHEALRPRLQANQMNAALMIAVFAADARSATVANAGMIAPLLLSHAPGLGPAFIEVGGLPIGTAINGLYREVTVRLEPGDTLIFLSDGIVEAHNRAGELYGFERLEALVAGLPPDLSVSEVAQHIIDAVLAFADGAEPHDDITIIATRPAAPAAMEVAGPLPVAAAGR